MQAAQPSQPPSRQRVLLEGVQPQLQHMLKKYEPFRGECNAKLHGCKARKGQPKKRVVVVSMIMTDDDFARLKLKISNVLLLI